MNEVVDAMVSPADFPELAKLLWNRDVVRPIPAQEAFELYERNWRHLDTENMTPKEAALVADLTKIFGHGVFLAT